VTPLRGFFKRLRGEDPSATQTPPASSATADRGTRSRGPASSGPDDTSSDDSTRTRRRGRRGGRNRRRSGDEGSQNADQQSQRPSAQTGTRSDSNDSRGRRSDTPSTSSSTTRSRSDGRNGSRSDSRNNDSRTDQRNDSRSGGDASDDKSRSGGRYNWGRRVDNDEAGERSRRANTRRRDVRSRNLDAPLPEDIAFRPGSSGGDSSILPTRRKRPTGLHDTARVLVGGARTVGAWVRREDGVDEPRDTERSGGPTERRDPRESAQADLRRTSSQGPRRTDDDDDDDTSTAAIAPRDGDEAETELDENGEPRKRRRRGRRGGRGRNRSASDAPRDNDDAPKDTPEDSTDDESDEDDSDDDVRTDVRTNVRSDVHSGDADDSYGDHNEGEDADEDSDEDDSDERDAPAPRRQSRGRKPALAAVAEADLPQAFAKMGVSLTTLETMARFGFQEPTPIQVEAIPALLNGLDVVGIAQTGSGKTVAFGVPMVERIDPSIPEVQGIVLVPTRELAQQVLDVLADLGEPWGLEAVGLLGGRSLRNDFRALEGRPHIVVGTPGRILDHLGRQTLSLRHVTYAVLDEADQMLDIGFLPDIRRILSRTPQRRQTALFSATMPGTIKRLIWQFMTDPETVRVDAESTTVDTIEQIYFEVANRDKVRAMRELIERELKGRTLIFCNMKRGVDHLARELDRDGVRVGALHGDMDQRRRDSVVREFREGSLDVLIATNVAARGLDIPEITHVVNYDVPQNLEEYVHRIGRTGRAGRDGKAITFVSEWDMGPFDAITSGVGIEIAREELDLYNRGPARSVVEVPSVAVVDETAADDAADDGGGSDVDGVDETDVAPV
jgi:ATP-dependent RNA helicase DeaD